MADCDSLFDVVRKRRTARAYASRPVSRKAVQAVLEWARWAPSAANRQPWEFIVIDDGATKERLRQAFVAEGAAHDRQYQSVTAKQAELLSAPVLIAVCGDPGAKARFINATEIPEANREELFLMSLGAAIQNILLAAANLGLCSTWMARLARVPGAREILQVPSALRLVSFVVLGYGTDPPFDEALRVPVARKTHYRAFGHQDAPPTELLP